MNKRTRILIVYGTRPEIIKMAPVIQVLQRSEEFEPIICATGQHRELLDQMTEVFGFTPDYDLNVMRDRQTLFQVTTQVLEGAGRIIESVKPRFVLVQGDTTTTFASSLAAFYHQVPVGHIEAGLRTYDLKNPFPEEMNRRLTTHIATVHFAPTDGARSNLIREGVPTEDIVVTGNTVVDSLSSIALRLDRMDDLLPSYDFEWNDSLPILVTAHRRENWGQGIEQICRAVRDIVEWDSRVRVFFPVHPNPVVRNIVAEHLHGLSRVYLIPPLSYLSFVALMRRCRIVITDSGGIQEEVASLGKYVIITRETTERPEVVSCGLGVLTGTDPNLICKAVKQMIDTPKVETISPFGDGRAAERIVNHLSRLLSTQRPHNIMARGTVSGL